MDEKSGARYCNLFIISLSDLRLENSSPELGALPLSFFEAERRRTMLKIRCATQPLKVFMRKREQMLDEAAQQWSWKLTLTIFCAVVGAIVAVYLFRLL